jgi:hypothetical protein
LALRVWRIFSAGRYLGSELQTRQWQASFFC